MLVQGVEYSPQLAQLFFGVVGTRKKSRQEKKDGVWSFGETRVAVLVQRGGIVLAVGSDEDMRCFCGIFGAHAGSVVRSEETFYVISRLSRCHSTETMFIRQQTISLC